MGLQRGTRREGLVGGVRAQRGGQARQNVALFEPSVREVAAEHRLVARHGVARLRQLRRGCVARRHERIVCGRRALEGGGGECHAPNVARAEWPLPPRGAAVGAELRSAWAQRDPVERVRRRNGPCGTGSLSATQEPPLPAASSALPPSSAAYAPQRPPHTSAGAGAPPARQSDGRPPLKQGKDVEKTHI
jgi:hypothetical protein